VKTFLRVVAMFSALALGACDATPAGVNGGVLPGAKGNVQFALVPQGPVSEGNNTFSMKLVDVRTMQPVTGAMLTLHTLMPAMGHQTLEGTVEEQTPGTYVLSGIVFDMPGDWALRVQASSSAVADEVEFPLNVP
jgi:hypothetical protein